MTNIYRTAVCVYQQQGKELTRILHVIIIFPLGILSYTMHHLHMPDLNTNTWCIVMVYDKAVYMYGE